MLGNRLIQQKIIARAAGNGDFQNAAIFYRFKGNYRVPDTVPESEAKRLGFSRPDLLTLIGEILSENALDLKERKSYGECFTGAELVKYLLARQLVASTRDAMLVGRLMMQEKLLQHVKDKHPFKNANLLYRFRGDKQLFLSQVSRQLSNSRQRQLEEKRKESDSELEWEFVQSFGDDNSAYDCDGELERTAHLEPEACCECECALADADDLVTAVEFNETGEFLAIGDKAGRVSIVQEAFQAQPTSVLG